MKLVDILIEGREEFIASTQDQKIQTAFNNDSNKPKPVMTSLEIVKYLSKINPKNVQWLVRQYINNNFKLEDTSQIKKDIEQFNKLCISGLIDRKDLNSYDSINDVRKIISSLSAGDEYSHKLEKLYNGINKAVNNGLGIWLYNVPTDPIKIYIPETVEGSIIIRRAYPDIKWCTTYELESDETVIDRLVDLRIDDEVEAYLEDVPDRLRYDKSYVKQLTSALKDKLLDHLYDEVDAGELDLSDYQSNRHNYYLDKYAGEYYVILTPEGPFQFHFESKQFKDQMDHDINYDQFIQKYPKVGILLEKRRHTV